MKSCLLSCLATLFLYVSAAGAADVSGKWSGNFAGGPVYLILKQDGAKLSGSGGPSETQQVLKFDNGKVEDDRLVFQVGPIQFDLHLTGQSLKGEMKNGDETVSLTLTRAEALQKTAQAAADTTKTFEVASVKANKSGAGGAITGRGGSIRLTKGQLSIENVSLWKGICFAYGVSEDKDYALSSPGWMKDDRYDIVAKFPADTPSDQLRVMFQNLLAERFKLTLHRETKEVPVYALVVAKSGSKLHEAEFGNGSFNLVRGQVKAQKASLAAFADRLSQYLDRPVLDATGLAGVFDFTLTWTPDEKPAPAAVGDAPEAVSGPSIFTAIQEQLGLRLEARKGPIETLVVDHAERVPVEN